MIADHDIEALEFQSNQQIQMIRQKLEAYQKQKVPTEPEELVRYLVERLKAAEDAINTQEEVIVSERKLRKQQSIQFKDQNKLLREQVEAERKNLGDKVSEHLDFTLKQAVNETVQIKLRLKETENKHRELENEYQELQDMYSTVKDAEVEDQKLIEQSQNVIEQLKKDLAHAKDDKEKL